MRGSAGSALSFAAAGGPDPLPARHTLVYPEVFLFGTPSSPSPLLQSNPRRAQAVFNSFLCLTDSRKPSQELKEGSVIRLVF